LIVQGDPLVSGPAPYDTVAMRKAVTLWFYLLLIGVGAWAVYEWLVLGGSGIIFKAGGFLDLFGAYLIWMDFLSPNRGRL
jgi:CDP-diglyceride synthetase